MKPRSEYDAEFVPLGGDELDKLKGILNAYASRGWELVEIVPSHVDGIPPAGVAIFKKERVILD